jgi:hypothetical protein
MNNVLQSRRLGSGSSQRSPTVSRCRARETLGITCAVAVLAVTALTACDSRSDAVTGISTAPASAIAPSNVQAPEVRILAPEDGATVSGTVAIEVRAKERDNDLDRTDLLINGESATSSTQERFTYNWSTNGLPGGDYYIMAVAWDVEGWSTSSSITLTVPGEDGPPAPPPPLLAYVALDPDTIVAGETSAGKAVLDGPAPAGGTEVGLASNNPALTTITPSIVTVPEGDSIGTFTVAGAPVAQPDWAAITGTTGTGQGDYRTAVLWVLPAGLTIDSLTLDPTLVVGGEISEGTVRLTGPAPEAGAMVELTSNNTDRATVPPNVTVPAGETTASFTVTTLPITVPGSVLISGSYAGVTRSAWLTVDRAPSGGGELASLTINPDQVVGGQDSQGTVTLGGAVGSDTEVALSSTDPSVATVPSSVTVPAGATSATFTITTLPNTTGQGQFSWISGEAGGVERGASITTTGAPSGPSATSVTFAPSSVGGGGPVTGFVTFDGPITDGVLFTFSSSDPDIVQVPSGDPAPQRPWSPNVRAFPVTTSSVSSNTVVTITATACCGGVGQVTGTLTVTTAPPPPPDVVEIISARWRPGGSGGTLEVRATSTSESALLSVYMVRLPDRQLMWFLRPTGGGRYEGVASFGGGMTNPEEIELRSNLGGSATSRVRD